MGIKSTQEISRENAIDRIKKIYDLAQESNYKSIQENTNEDNEQSIQDFVLKYRNTGLIDIENIDKFTNEMLEEIMDKPFFRYSMFDNYFVDKSTFEDVDF